MITKRINTRALSNTAVSILALGLLAGCAASPTTSGTTAAPVAEVDESLCALDAADEDADATATPSATDEADNADETDLSVTDKLKNSAKDTVKETATDALSSAAFLFGNDCVASTTSVSVTIPDELRTEIGATAAKALPPRRLHHQSVRAGQQQAVCRHREPQLLEERAARRGLHHHRRESPDDQG